VRRRDALALTAAAAAAPVLGQTPAGGAAPKVLRVVFPVAETGFDPARISDVYSATVNTHIFESLYVFDYLARPVKLKARVAAGMPETSADHRVWTFRIRPGIFYSDDPAFNGTRRELVAQDQVYSLKRFADPANTSPNWPSVAEWRVVGLAAQRERALKDKKPFDYDAPVEGLRVLDRHTLQITLERPMPRFAENFTLAQTAGALVAREVVEFYGDKIMEHPVGTGPFRLASWRRSSRIVLERNPNFRDERWDAEPAAGDAEGQAILRRMQGRPVPCVDRVEVSIVEEAQPRWLSFVNGQCDLLPVPQEFGPTAMPGGKLAPNLVKLGVQAWRLMTATTQLSFFNMEHPVVGGNAPHQVALRRAVFLSMDLQREIDLVFRGMGIPAQSQIPPYCSGYDPAYKSENSDHDPARARALLDLYGWVDRDGDGWRETPDGQPLVIECATQPDQLSRQRDELLKKSLDAIGVRVLFKPAKWPENLKAARAGKLMFWRVGSTSTLTDGQSAMSRLYGPDAGQSNIARFRLQAFDEVYERLTTLPDGPQREALFLQAKRLATAYAPYKSHTHQLVDVVAQAHVQGFRRPHFGYEWWHRVDIDSPRPQAS
jgi:ABC-type transport system substrate-binding protein